MVAPELAVPPCPGECGGAFWQLRVINKSAHYISIRVGEDGGAAIDSPLPLVTSSMVAECQVCGYQPEQWSVLYKKLNFLRLKDQAKNAAVAAEARRG